MKSKTKTVFVLVSLICIYFGINQFILSKAKSKADSIRNAALIDYRKASELPLPVDYPVAEITGFIDVHVQTKEPTILDHILLRRVLEVSYSATTATDKEFACKAKYKISLIGVNEIYFAQLESRNFSE